MTLTQLFTNIANAIRAKTGSSETIKAENFPTEIADITTGTDTSDANAEPINIRKDKTAYVNGEKITGTLPVLTYPVNPDNPSDFDYQFIEASTAKKVTRASTDYIMGAYQIAGNNEPDSWMFEGNRKMKLGIAQSKVATAISLKGEQIKKGEKILGVTGTYEGEGSNDYNAKYNATPPSNKTTLSQNLVEIPEFDFVNLTSAANFFSSIILSKVLFKNTQNVTNFSNFFYYASNLIEIPEEIDCSSATNLGNMFYYCSKIKKVKLTNTENVETCATMFQNCTALEEVDIGTMSNKLVNVSGMFQNCSKLKTAPFFDTSGIVGGNIGSIFKGCSLLENVPVFNFSSVTKLNNVFTNCPNLSNESLNNVLAMCIGATSITTASYKTLKQIGLTSAQATTCQTLSNWDDFVAAGWTTGY